LGTRAAICLEYESWLRDEPEDSHIPEFIAWVGRFFDDLGLEEVSFAGH
jgi:hypothetical protein